MNHTYTCVVSSLVTYYRLKSLCSVNGRKELIQNEPEQSCLD